MLKHVNEFMIFYGPLDSKIITDIKDYDMVIIEPRHFSLADIQNISSEGTSLFGYISVMEWPVWNVKRGENLHDSDFLLQHDQRKYFEEWDSYLMDLRRAHYREILLEEITEQIMCKSLDGIFLDTVGDIDDYIDDPLTAHELIHSYLKLISDIRLHFPHLGMIQNRGFSFIQQAATNLDGFLWEGWQEEQITHVWVRQQLKSLKSLQKKGLQLFAVSNDIKPNKGKKAKRHGFIHLSRGGEYTKWPD